MENLDSIFTEAELDIQIIFNPYNRKGVVIFRQVKLKQYFSLPTLSHQMLVKLPNIDGKFLKLVYIYGTALSLRVDLVAPNFYKTGFAEWTTRGLENPLIQIVSTDDEFKLYEAEYGVEDIVEGRDLTTIASAISTKLEMPVEEVIEGDALLLYLFIARHICPLMMQGEGELYEVDIDGSDYIGKLYLDVGLKNQSHKLLNWVEERIKQMD